MLQQQNNLCYYYVLISENDAKVSVHYISILTARDSSIVATIPPHNFSLVRKFFLKKYKGAGCTPFLEFRS